MSSFSQPLLRLSLLSLLNGLTALVFQSAYGQIPAIAAEAQVQNTPIYAVLPFENNSPQQAAPWLSKHLAEHIMLLLQRQQGIRLIERSAIEGIVKELNLGQSAFSQHAEQAPAIGKVLGANVLVQGSYTLHKDQITIHLRFLDVATSEVIKDSIDEVHGPLAQLNTLKAELENHINQVALKNNPEALKRQRFYKEAQQAIVQGEFIAAETLINQALENNPYFGEGYLTLAEIYLSKFERSENLQDAKESLAWVNQALTVQPELIPAIVFKINLLERYKKNEQAKQVFESGIARYPGNSELIVAGLGLYEKELSAAQLAPQVLLWKGDLNHPDIQEQLGMILTNKAITSDKKDFTEAILLLKQSYQQAPQKQHLLLRIATAYWGAGQNDLSLQYLKQLATADPAPSGWYRSMGNMAHMNANAYREKKQDTMTRESLRLAEQFLTEALNVEPNSPWVLSELATIKIEQGDFQGAEALLLTALEQQRPTEEVYLAVSKAFERQKKTELAISTLEDGVRKLPELTPFLRINLNNLYQKKGNLTQAREVLLPLIESDELQWKSLGYQQLLMIAGNTKDWESVKRLYPHYLETNPDEEASTLAWATQTYQEALLFLALKANPRDANALNDLGQLALQMGDLPKAQTYLEEALRYAPQQAAIHYNLGLLFLERRDLQKSRMAFNQALQRQPQYPKAEYNLVFLLVEQKQYAEALKRLSELQQQYPDFSDFNTLYQEVKKRQR